ncbi:MAG: carbon-nitrogen hydrolase family protein [Pirellulales bacterium]
MSALLRVATCQFPVSGDVAQNRDYIVAQIAAAAASHARLAHFPESALSGYAGVDLPSSRDFDWSALRAGLEAVAAAAAQHKVWVVVGSAHRLSGDAKPHNSMYVISDEGQIVDRYDKRFCTGAAGPEPTLDLLHYTPGNHTCVFDVDGVRCGVLICYDYRFPELFRELKRRGVELLLHAYHNARKDRETFEHGNLWKDVVPAVMMAAAAQNYFWVSATNSTAQYSFWPSFFVRPDGLVTARLAEHEPGMLISDVRRDAGIWDAPGIWRDRALEGCLYSGELLDDPRSQDRTCY